METLRLLRFSKLQRMLLEDLFTAPSAIQLPNISQEEINYFRPFLNTPQEILQSLEEAEERSDRSEGSKKMVEFFFFYSFFILLIHIFVRLLVGDNLLSLKIFIKRNLLNTQRVYCYEELE